ncbi:hypothetical protein [Legionella rowbothamii]|nr:hypothetical protein [Legionella rowbothamii]
MYKTLAKKARYSPQFAIKIQEYIAAVKSAEIETGSCVKSLNMHE